MWYLHLFWYFLSVLIFMGIWVNSGFRRSQMCSYEHISTFLGKHIETGLLSMYLKADLLCHGCIYFSFLVNTVTQSVLPTCTVFHFSFGRVCIDISLHIKFAFFSCLMTLSSFHMLNSQMGILFCELLYVFYPKRYWIFFLTDI